MINIEIDATAFKRQLTGLERDQLPFAVMKALNKTGTDFQEAERGVIARNFTLRRATFIRNTVKIERGNFATKANLRTIINIDPTRDVLSKFEEGKDKTPREGSSIAIPVAAKRNKSDIVTRANRPKAYQLQDTTSSGSTRIAKGLKRVFMIKKADGTGGIFQRVGRGAASTIRELFTFEPRVPIPRSLHFYATARKTVAEKFPKNFRDAFANAMRTAR